MTDKTPDPAALDVSIVALRAHCNRVIKLINMVGADKVPGFSMINALLKSCDKVFAAHDAQQRTTVL